MSISIGSEGDAFDCNYDRHGLDGREVTTDLSNYEDLDRLDLLQLLKEKESSIAILERSQSEKVKARAQLQSKLEGAKLKHKEECYWLRLDLDSICKDKEAVEDRIAELYRDMREIDGMDMERQVLHVTGAEETAHSGYVTYLQYQLSKSRQTMAVLDNQIGMVKHTCDEIVKSLKEEILEVMEDKSCVEMELLNQLSTLDDEKHKLQEGFEVMRSQNQCKEERIVELKKEVTILQEQVVEAANAHEPSLVNARTSIVSAALSRAGDVGGDTNGIGEPSEEMKKLFEKTQQDVFAVVQKLKKKNEEISEKEKKISEQTANEGALRQELVHMMRRVQDLEKRGASAIKLCMP